MHNMNWTLMFIAFILMRTSFNRQKSSQCGQKAIIWLLFWASTWDLTEKSFVISAFTRILWESRQTVTAATHVVIFFQTYSSSDVSLKCKSCVGQTWDMSEVFTVQTKNAVQSHWTVSDVFNTLNLPHIVAHCKAIWMYFTETFPHAKSLRH